MIANTELKPFFDTNILLYSVSTNPADVLKRERAASLLGRADGALSVQVLREFYAQATRPTRRRPLPHDVAVNLIRAWSRFRVQEVNLAVLNAALEIHAVHRFSCWDSAIIAAARALGCQELYTEDMSHGRQVEGILIINPFR
jgi:predicted nucleic acid-binding protein